MSTLAFDVGERKAVPVVSSSKSEEVTGTDASSSAAPIPAATLTSPTPQADALIRAREFPGFGRGAACVNGAKSGDLLYRESPAFITVPIDYRTACGHCAAALRREPHVHTPVARKRVTRKRPTPSLSPPRDAAAAAAEHDETDTKEAPASALSCSRCAYEFYCGAQCRDAAWIAHHRVVCGRSPNAFRKAASSVKATKNGSVLGLHLAVARLMCRQLSHPKFTKADRSLSLSSSSPVSSSSITSLPSSAPTSEPLTSSSDSLPPPPPPPAQTRAPPAPGLRALDTLFPEFERLTAGGAGCLHRPTFVQALRHLCEYTTTKDARFTYDWYVDAYDRLQRNAFLVTHRDDDGGGGGGSKDGGADEKGGGGNESGDSSSARSTTRPIAYACYARHSLMRHSCAPNVRQNPNGDMRAVLDVPPGAQLFIAHCDTSLDVNARVLELVQRFGVLCRCARCRAEASQLTPDTKMRVRSKLDAWRHTAAFRS